MKTHPLRASPNLYRQTRAASRLLYGALARQPSPWRPGWLIADQLDWFTSTEAQCVLRDHGAAIPGLDQFFGFARAMTIGCAFAAPSGTVVQFVGWQSKLMVRPGMILLDAFEAGGAK
jgi:hypothetical protein